MLTRSRLCYGCFANPSFCCYCPPSPLLLLLLTLSGAHSQVLRVAPHPTLRHSAVEALATLPPASMCPPPPPLLIHRESNTSGPHAAAQHRQELVIPSVHPPHHCWWWIGVRMGAVGRAHLVPIPGALDGPAIKIVPGTDLRPRCPVRGLQEV